MCRCEYGRCKEGCDCRCHIPDDPRDTEIAALKLQNQELENKYLNAISNGGTAIEMGNVERERRIVAERQLSALKKAVEVLSVAYQARNYPLPPAMVDAWADVNVALRGPACGAEKRNESTPKEMPFTREMFEKLKSLPHPPELDKPCPEDENL